MSPIHTLRSTSTSTKFLWFPSLLVSVVLGLSHSCLHFHHSGSCLVPQEGVKLSYTSCLNAGDHARSIEYVVPDKPPADLEGLVDKSLQNLKNVGGCS